MKNILLIGAACMALAACSTVDDLMGGDDAAAKAAEAAAANSAKLAAVLEAQDDDAKARYQYRNPQATLEFFGIEPGMTVVDSLPGKVWYAGILSDYLGPKGKVIGVDYSMEMWPLFGGFATEEWLAKRADWKSTWLADMAEGVDADDAPVDAFVYGSLPEDMHGTADAVLMVRAAHHFNRFEDEGGFFTQALADVSNVLKDGGTLGIVQHRAPEGNSDEASEGDNGYVKQSRIITFVEAAGFELVESSEINANPKDAPSDSDIVWRLPPTLGTSRDNEELRAEMQAIGESDRMTLKFRKQ